MIKLIITPKVFLIQLIAFDSFLFIFTGFSSKLFILLIGSSISMLLCDLNGSVELFFNNIGSLFALILLIE